VTPPPHAAAGPITPLALSDAGDRALVRMDEFGFGNSYRLELWDLASDGLRKAWSIAPYGDMEGGDRDVKWARFLGPDRFATLGGKGKLVVWDLEPVKPRTIVAVDENCTPGLSPDGRFLAFGDKGNVGVLEVESGRIAALQTIPSQHVDSTLDPRPEPITTPEASTFLQFLPLRRRLAHVRQRHLLDSRLTCQPLVLR